MLQFDASTTSTLKFSSLLSSPLLPPPYSIHLHCSPSLGGIQPGRVCPPTRHSPCPAVAMLLGRPVRDGCSFVLLCSVDNSLPHRYSTAVCGLLSAGAGFLQLIVLSALTPQLPNLTLLSLPLCISLPASKPSDILQAEETIRSNMRALEGVQAPPNILAGFQTVDTKRSGKYHLSVRATLM